MIFLIFFGILFLFLAFLLIKATYVVKQAEVVIIERFGSFQRVLKPGLNFVMPFADKPRQVLWTFIQEEARSGNMYRFSRYIERIDLRESVYDFPKQNVITKDNVTMEINALLYFQITDPIAATYEIDNLPQGIEKLTQTTLRNIIGSLDLDESLTSRDMINEKLTLILDEATDKWGVKVNRVELQEVNPPRDIRDAMEKQMRAERDRRAHILEAEGFKTAAVLEAEGKKSAAILEAEGVQMSQVMRAKGESDARRLLAQGEADAIKLVRDAIPNQDPLPYMTAINYIKVLPEMMKDKNGKLIVIPYEASAVMGSLSGIKTLFKDLDKS